MHKIKEVLRLKYLNQLSNRQIETMTRVSRSSVSNYLKVYETLEMKLEVLLELNDVVLNDLFSKNTASSVVKKIYQRYIQTGQRYEKSLVKKG